jgi:hypothetical protein
MEKKEKPTIAELEERYSRAVQRLLHVEKQLESLDVELVALVDRLQDLRTFDEDEDIGELNKLQKTWDHLYTECLRYKKEKYDAASKLRKMYLNEMKTNRPAVVRFSLEQFLIVQDLSNTNLPSSAGAKGVEKKTSDMDGHVLTPQDIVVKDASKLGTKRSTGSEKDEGEKAGKTLGELGREEETRGITKKKTSHPPASPDPFLPLDKFFPGHVSQYKSTSKNTRLSGGH